MTRAALAAYLTTQSNVADEPPERIRDWFDAELAPFFAGGRGRRVVRFRGSCRLGNSLDVPVCQMTPGGQR